MFSRSEKRPIPMAFLFYFTVMGVVGFTLITSFFQWHRLIELFSHFKMAYFTVAFLTFLFAFYYRRFLFSLLLLGTLAINAAFILPWYFSHGGEAKNKSMTLLHANVLSRNDRHDALLALIEQQDPDIIMVQEFNASWQNALGTLRKQYPYFIELPRLDNFGIAFYSRLPTKSIEEKYWSLPDIPSVQAQVRFENRIVHVISTHPVPPIGSYYYQLRNQQLEYMMQDVNKLTEPVIVSGDFNLTFWSQQYQKLGLTQLTNTRQGYGPLPSWPTALGVFGIPIDHIIVSDDFEYHNTRLGADIGSDHRPVITQVSFKE